MLFRLGLRHNKSSSGCEPVGQVYHSRSLSNAKGYPLLPLLFNRLKATAKIQ